LRNGKAEYASYNAAKAQEIVNSIKIAYSQKAIERVAKKYKFKLTQKADNTITLRRY
jgi:hypothetical protein